jgi:ABC-2 type transport system permease protein
MRPYLVLVRRELGWYACALSSYVTVAAVLFLLGLGFVSLLEAFNGETLNAPLTEVFYDTMYFWLVLLLAPPVITMRLFAQERATGTFETLMTAPVGDAAVVLAKFTAALGFYLVTWLPLLVCLAVVRQYIPEHHPLDWRPVASTYLGIALLGGVYVALGCLASALTRSQLLAAVLALALGVTLFLVSFLRSSVGTGTDWLAATVRHVSLLTHMEDFVRGVVDTRPLVFHLSLTVWLVFLTVKVVESRRWK